MDPYTDGPVLPRWSPKVTLAEGVRDLLQRSGR